MAELDDSDTLWHPTWLVQPRGFVDKRPEEAESFNALLMQHLIGVRSWTGGDIGWTFYLTNTIVTVMNDDANPLQVTATSDTISRRFLDGMRQELRTIIQKPQDSEWKSTLFAVTLLQLVEEAVSWQLMWQRRFDPEVEAGERCGSLLGEALHLQRQGDPSACRWESILGTLHAVRNAAHYVLRRSIDEICSGVSADYRILHVEPILRGDLAARFLARKAKIQRDLLLYDKKTLLQCASKLKMNHGTLEKTYAGLVQALAQPSLTFHGAPRRFIESVVRHGFVVPGKEIGDTRERLQVRCGSTFGRGIYSSPDPMYASSYMDYVLGDPSLTRPSDVAGMRLVVCATLIGCSLVVSRGSARGVSGALNPSVHSHISPNGSEYIVFNSAQMVPCYALHLDYGAEEAQKQFDKMAADPAAFSTAAKQQRLPSRT